MRVIWRDIAIALILAVGLWYSVSGSEKIETQIEVRLEYKGLPSGLVIRDGLVNKLSVQVRAPAGLLRSLSERSFNYSLDISSITKGVNTLSIPHDVLPLWGGIDVISVQPSVVELNIDTLEKKIIPLSLKLSGRPSSDLIIETHISPQEIEVSGPSDIVASLQGITLTAPMPVEHSATPYESKIHIPIPEGSSTTTREATISIITSKKMETVSVSRPVICVTEDNTSFSVTPRSVTLKLLAPVSLAKILSKSKEIIASVPLASTEPGEYILPVEVSLPEEISLLEVDPKAVSVVIPKPSDTTRKSKQQ